MTVINTIHRFLGETLMLVALIGVILAFAGLFRKEALTQAEDVFGRVYAVLLDIQALLGLVSFVSLLLQGVSGLVTSVWILHPISMILALVAVHASRRWRQAPVAAIRHRAQLIAYGASLLFLVVGRMIAA